ncbi:hypothetical protein ACWDYJ_34570 [Streptomyces sp. NPDC003042]
MKIKRLIAEQIGHAPPPEPTPQPEPQPQPQKGIDGGGIPCGG